MMRTIARRFCSPTTLLAAATGLAISQGALAQTVFYSENFDGAAPTSQSGDLAVAAACSSGGVFTHVPPAGWSWNACGVPTYACRVGGCPTTPPNCGGVCTAADGVFEWEGWSFANKLWWVAVAGDQNRSQFTKGQGIVAVADPDEWDDRGNPDGECGEYNAFMATPAIDITSIDSGSLTLTFDSSWRPETNQTAIVSAIYTVGGIELPGVEVLRWESPTASPFYKPDSTNETVTLSGAQLNIPEGATAVRFEYGLVRAINNWWWAIDNVAIAGTSGGSPAPLFFEDFESVTLEPPVHEDAGGGCAATYCGQNVYTHNGPNGSAVTVDGPADGGVPDWRGWSFVTPAYWRCVSGGNGNNFLNASGRIAVADGDEFDDLPHAPGALDTTFSTPVIDLSARTGSFVVLTFDSSWRPEQPQTASVVAVFDNGTEQTIIDWRSVAGEFFKPAAENERVAVLIDVPADASSVTLKFRYVGGNNWWWAIDNIDVFEGEATVTVAQATPSTGVMGVGFTTDFAACFTPWSPTPPNGWSSLFSPIGACPTECGRPEWRGWAFAHRTWWWQNVDDQRRSEFTLASGFIAIADPDEWDDFPNGESNFNAFMTTPSITLPGSIGSISLDFVSSWRDEGFDDTCSCNPPGSPPTNNQTATIKAFYTVGGVEQAAVEVLRWDSDPNGPFFHDDNPNEVVSIAGSSLQVPAGASSVRFEFALTNARNDWWWAVDNIALNVNNTIAFSEDFEGVPNRQAPPTENPPTSLCSYFATVLSQGLNFITDNSLLGTCQPNTDFYGFNTWLTEAWAAAGGGLRSQFGSATAFVSDFGQGDCTGTARLETPAYSISNINPGSMTLNFRSGWEAAAGHASTVEVSFDGGPWTSILSWNPANKATNTDEMVSLGVDNPEGSATVRFRFSDSNSGWWAVSEIDITGTVGSACSPCAADFNRDEGVDDLDISAFFMAFESGEACADVNNDDGIDDLDISAFFAAFESGC